jgi:hypothetical protein
MSNRVAFWFWLVQPEALWGGSRRSEPRWCPYQTARYIQTAERIGLQHEGDCLVEASRITEEEKKLTDSTLQRPLQADCRLSGK